MQGLALEANQQELAQPKTGCGCGGGSDVKGKRLPNPEPIEEPEAGMLSIKHANYRVSVSFPQYYIFNNIKITLLLL